MKITITQYARAFYDSTKDKTPDEIDLLVENFVKLLQKNNQIRLVGKIIDKFTALYNTENGVVEAQVTSANPLDEEALKNVESFIAKKYDARKVLLINDIKKEIKGGIIITVDDEMMDASIAKKISSFKMALIK